MNDVKAIREARGKTTIHKSASPFPSAENGPGLSPCSLRNCVKKKRNETTTAIHKRTPRARVKMNEWKSIGASLERGEKISFTISSSREHVSCMGVCWPSFPSFSFVSWRSLCYKVCVCVFLHFSSCRFFCGLITNYAGCASVFFWMKLPPTRTLFFSPSCFSNDFCHVTTIAKKGWAKSEKILCTVPNLLLGVVHKPRRQLKGWVDKGKLWVIHD